MEANKEDVNILKQSIELLTYTLDDCFDYIAKILTPRPSASEDFKLLLSAKTFSGIKKQG